MAVAILFKIFLAHCAAWNTRNPQYIFQLTMKYPFLARKLERIQKELLFRNGIIQCCEIENHQDPVYVVN